MTLPTSGQIALSDVNVELGQGATTFIGLGDANVRNLFGIASGQIALSDGYGKSNISHYILLGPLAGVNELDSYNACVIDSSKNTYFFGSGGATSYYWRISKFNSSGVEQWRKKINWGSYGSSTWSSTNYGSTVPLVIDTSGNMYGVISAYNSSVGARSIYFKIDSNGSLVWDQNDGQYGKSSVTLIPNYNTSYVFITGASGGGALIFGVSTSTGDYSSSYSWGSSSSDSSTNRIEINNIAPSTSSWIAVSGINQSNRSAIGKIECGYWYAHFMYSMTINGIGNTTVSIKTDSSNNIYIGGYCYNIGTSSTSSFVAKLNSSGSLQWQRYFYYGANTTLVDMVLDSSNNVYVISNVLPDTGYPSSSQYHTLLIKYNSSGTVQFQRKIKYFYPYQYDVTKNSGSVYSRNIDIDSDGSLHISGMIAPSTNSQRAFSIKVPSDGSKTGTYSISENPSGQYIEYASFIATETTGSYISLTSISPTGGTSLNVYQDTSGFLSTTTDTGTTTKLTL